MTTGDLAPSVLSDEETTRLGRALLEAFETATPIEPLTVAHPDLSPDEAYAIQRVLLRGHAELGRKAAARKIGLTNPAMQKQLGVDSPDCGVVFDAYVLPGGARLSRSGLRMIWPRLEPEIGFVLERDLGGPGVTAADVLAATRAVVPVFELIDSRIRDWRIGLADTIADNASGLGLILGEEVPLDAVGPLGEVSVLMRGPDGTAQEGKGSAVMGDPALAVAWLANELHRRGEVLPAGIPILAGSLTAAIDAVPGAFEASFGEVLGSVRVQIEP
jgi:2-keto-4-pentenoate hydratase